MNKQTVGDKSFVKLRHQLLLALDGINEQYYYDHELGDVVWQPDEGIMFEIVPQLGRFYDELKPFLKSLGIDDDVFDELIRYQEFIVNTPDKKVREMTFDFDFNGYFRAAELGAPEKLRAVRNTVSVHGELCYPDMLSYSREVIWFGRRLDLSIFDGDKADVTYL